MLNGQISAASAERQSVPRLFTPGRIGPVELKNRVVMPPMTTRCADRDGFVTDEVIAYYGARADGGVGLVTVEMSAPERAGRHRNFELGIHDDAFVPGLRRLVDAVHARGAKVSIQLGHGGGHTRIDISGETPIAPSAIPHVVQEGHTETIIPEEMSLDRIERTIQAFADAARRAEKAGFDAVEIHAAHGYLISQFLAPAENLRQDAYGGCLRNRARFGIEIVRRVKAAVPGLGLVFRLNGDDFFPGGMPFEEARQVAAWAAEAGADAIHVTGGHYRSLPSAAVMIPPMAMPDATFLHFAAAVKRDVNVPVIAVGRLGDPEAAIRAVEDGKADFVALGRPLLADAEWVNRVQAGKSVRMCIACNTCVDGMRAGGKLHCLVNAATGRELKWSQNEAARATRERGRRIAVVGAGPAGLTYASLAAAHNEVTVFERASHAGGAFLIAGLAPKFQGVDANPASLERYIRRLEQQCREKGVTFVFDCDVGRQPERLGGFDLVVLAIGADYRWGLGSLAVRALRHGAFRWPGLRKLAASPRVRDWFYDKARVSPAARLRNCLPEGTRVLVIGDAKRPGKSQDAILDAFEAALS
jgi:2,4-dienoyl-CoA reductase-like NADH-dependent reductase (Old Yellow Enzyme family)